MYFRAVFAPIGPGRFLNLPCSFQGPALLLNTLARLFRRTLCVINYREQFPAGGPGRGRMVCFFCLFQGSVFLVWNRVRLSRSFTASSLFLEDILLVPWHTSVISPCSSFGQCFQWTDGTKLMWNLTLISHGKLL